MASSCGSVEARTVLEALRWGACSRHSARKAFSTTVAAARSSSASASASAPAPTEPVAEVQSSAAVAGSSSSKGDAAATSVQRRRAAPRQKGGRPKERPALKYEYADDGVLGSHDPLAHLPPRSQWTEAFKKGRSWSTSHRFFLGNRSTIDTTMNALDLPRRSKEAGRKLTILEGYPGAGTMTRRFLLDDNVEKVLAIEDHASFLPYIEKLAQDPLLSEKASKLTIKDKNCYNWESYAELVSEGAFDHLSQVKDVKVHGRDADKGDIFADESWTSPSPVLFFCHLPSTVHGEQLIAQLVSSIANRLWQYQFTRMPIVLVCSEHLAQRCTAKPGDKLRSRMSVITQALADVRILLDSSHYLPHEEHFWPDTPMVGRRLPLTPTSIAAKKLSSGNAKEDNCLLLIEPKIKPMVSGVEMEAFEYLIRNLFVTKASTVKSSLKHMLPGAINILERMKSGHPAMKEIGPVSIEPTELIYELSVEQLVGLAKMFERWPFRPQHLFEEGRLDELKRTSK